MSDEPIAQLIEIEDGSAAKAKPLRQNFNFLQDQVTTLSTQLNNKMSSSGGSISGNLGITGSLTTTGTIKTTLSGNTPLILKNTTNFGSPSEAGNTYQDILFQDYNGVRRNTIRAAINYNSSGDITGTTLTLGSNGVSTSGSAPSGIQISCNSSGVISATAPTPPDNTTTSSQNIATCGWVNSLAESLESPWVKKERILSTSGAKGTQEIDFDAIPAENNTTERYLPDDDNNYEVLFSVTFTAPNNTVAHAYFDTWFITVARGKHGDGSNNNYGGHSFICPVKTTHNRKLNLIIGTQDDTGYFSAFKLKACAYRKTD